MEKNINLYIKKKKILGGAQHVNQGDVPGVWKNGKQLPRRSDNACF